MLSFLILIASLLLCYRVFYNPRKPKNYPPGPRWLPVVGCAPQFRKLARELGYQHVAFSWLSRHFDSPVIGLKLGNQLTVAVSGYDAVKRVLTGDEFEGRPDNFFIRLRCLGTRKGITFTDGAHWHEQRSFAVRHLRSLGFGKLTMESMILEQVAITLDKFESKIGIAMCPDLGPAVMSVLWALTAGTQFAENDPKLARLLDLMQRRGKAFDLSGGALAQFPWLRFIAPDATGYTFLKTVNSELHSFFLETIQDHHNTFCKDSEPRDLIDAYLKEMELRKDQKDSRFTDDQLVMVCLDLFVAGSTSTSNSLNFLLLYLSRYPEVQNKAQKEIDEVLGREQSPALADQARLPYVCATIMEILRVCSVSPIAGPRRVVRDTDVMGYTIPKDTMVLINTWSLHSDPTHWGDPETLRPERFISLEGKLTPDDWVMTYGLGRRRCLGEALARGCLFLFITSVLQRFHIGTTDPSPPAPPLPGLTLSPPPFNIILDHRQ